MRGDVYEVSAARNARGHEKRGRRYAVVVQTNNINLSTYLMSPTSTSAAPASFRPEIEIGDETTRVMVEQTRVMAAERLGRLVSRVSYRELTEIEDALRIVFELDRPFPLGGPSITVSA